MLNPSHVYKPASCSVTFVTFSLLKNAIYIHITHTVSQRTSVETLGFVFYFDLLL